MPFFSIILPTYNRTHFLPKAIASVLEQTFEDLELVIVDDGSTDNTREIVASFMDPRIVYIYQVNQERSVARNNGIKKATGQYICFLDSDDYFLPEKLSNFKTAIEQSTEDLKTLFYDGLVFEIDNERREVAVPLKDIQETTHEFLLQHPIGPLQVCGAKSIFCKHSFNPQLRIGEDVELWLRMASDFKFQGIQSYQTVVLEHEDRSVNLKKYNAAKEQLKQLDLIFRRYSYEQISTSVRRKMKSDCYFNIAKHFMMNNMKREAIYMTLKSIFEDLKNIQLKHRIYTLINLLTIRIPQEYKIE